MTGNNNIVMTIVTWDTRSMSQNDIIRHDIAVWCAINQGNVISEDSLDIDDNTAVVVELTELLNQLVLPEHVHYAVHEVWKHCVYTSTNWNVNHLYQMHKMSEVH